MGGKLCTTSPLTFTKPDKEGSIQAFILDRVLFQERSSWLFPEDLSPGGGMFPPAETE